MCEARGLNQIDAYTGSHKRKVTLNLKISTSLQHCYSPNMVPKIW